MKKVIIIGAGGHSAEITDYITHYNNSVAPELWCDVVGYIDDNKENVNNAIDSCPVAAIEVIDDENKEN